MALVSMERDLSLPDLRRCDGHSAELRTLYSDVYRQKIPTRIAELLGQLDQQLSQLDQKDGQH